MKQGIAAAVLATLLFALAAGCASTIEPSHLPRLFDRFFRAESSRSSEGQAHHGLGLSIVAAIARMHSGRTFAQSDGGITRLGFTVAAH